MAASPLLSDLLPVHNIPNFQPRECITTSDTHLKLVARRTSPQTGSVPFTVWTPTSLSSFWHSPSWGCRRKARVLTSGGRLYPAGLRGSLGAVPFPRALLYNSSVTLSHREHFSEKGRRPTEHERPKVTASRWQSWDLSSACDPESTLVHSELNTLLSVWCRRWN